MSLRRVYIAGPTGVPPSMFMSPICTGEHIRFGKADRDGVNCLAEDAAAWTDDEHASGWRDKVRRMWLGYPKLEPLH